MCEPVLSPCGPPKWQRCAMLECLKRTDQRKRFGQVRSVTANDNVVYHHRLRLNHDGVLCNQDWQTLHPSKSRPVKAVVVTHRPAVDEEKSPTPPHPTPLASLDLLVESARVETVSISSVSTSLPLITAPIVSVDNGEAVAGLLSLLQGPLSSSVPLCPSPVVVVETHSIVRTVSEPLRVSDVPVSVPCTPPCITRTRSTPLCNRPHVDGRTYFVECTREVLSHSCAVSAGEYTYS
jgi:hypothetical protein